MGKADYNSLFLSFNGDSDEQGVHNEGQVKTYKNNKMQVRINEPRESDKMKAALMTLTLTTDHLGCMICELLLLV